MDLQGEIERRIKMINTKYEDFIEFINQVADYEDHLISGEDILDLLKSKTLKYRYKNMYLNTFHNITMVCMYNTIVVEYTLKEGKVVKTVKGLVRY